MRGVVSVVDLLGGLLAALGAFLAIVAVRFVIAYANADTRRPFATAVTRTGRWTFGLLGGVFGAVALGLVQFGDLVGGFVGFVVSHPYFASNFGIAGVGAGAISGMFQLTTQQFLGIAFVIVGAVFVAMEADDVV